MNKEKKNNKIISAVATILFHLVLFLVLYFCTLKSEKKDDDVIEDGVPVMLGEVEDAGGMDMGGFPIPDATTDAASATETETAEEPLVTQDKEPSITVDDAKAKAKAEAQKKALAEKAEAERKAAEAAKKKAEAEAAAKAAVNNKVAGAFGNSKNKGSSGNGTGNGSQGSPTGNANYGATSGVGGVGVEGNVGSRTAKVLARPNYADATSEGTIIVSITVNAEGKVIGATIKSSTTTSSALRNAAIAAARKSSFTPGTEMEGGTITYKFKLK